MLANDVIFICATHVDPIPDVKDTAGDWQHGWVGIRLGSFSLWRCGRLDCRVIYHTNNSFTNRLNISVHELTGWLFVWLTDWLNDDLVVWLTAMFGGLLCARFIFFVKKRVWTQWFFRLIWFDVEQWCRLFTIFPVKHSSHFGSGMGRFGLFYGHFTYYKK